MSEKFLKIVVTAEAPVVDEVQTCVRLLEGGIDYIHLRHPDLTDEQMRRLVESFPQRWHSRLRVHSAFHLVTDMQLAGAHLNSRHPEAPQGMHTTRSCHSLAELADPRNAACDYLTLSPIFDSISKQGYRSKFDLTVLQSNLAHKCVIALGGVTPRSFPQLRDAGFQGAMMLGYIWEKSDTPLEVKLKEINLRCCNL